MDKSIKDLEEIVDYLPETIESVLARDHFNYEQKEDIREISKQIFYCVDLIKDIIKENNKNIL